MIDSSSCLLINYEINVSKTLYVCKRGVLEAAKAIIEEEIATKLEISTNSFFCIADFGCSTGSNSFPVMHTITEAIKQKYESPDLKTPEFYVWFNDIVSNDFNTLFSSLTPSHLIGATKF